MESMTKRRAQLIGLGLLLSSSASWGFGDFLKQLPSADSWLGGKSAPAIGTAVTGLSEDQIDAGLKEALSIGAERAVALLGKSGGFLDDQAVRIPLPGAAQTIAKGLRAAGQGKYVDQFELTLNRAAEQAVPQTLDIVKKVVQAMTLEDVRGILQGADDAATQFLRDKTTADLTTAIAPIIAQATDAAGVTSAYKLMVKQAGGSLSGLGGFFSGLSLDQSLDLDAYVTEKALDGLFLKLAAEEKAIRENPVARTTDLLKAVFKG